MKSKNLTDSPCNLCPRDCLAERKNGKTGYCRLDTELKVARAALHMWEEPCISGSRGSGAVFFSGCNLRCIYCQNREIAHQGWGKRITVPQLADIFLSLQEQGAANINLVTPDHYILKITEAVTAAREKGLGLPIIYNCSGYEKEEHIAYLKETVDIFLTDFKYMEEKTAEKYSFAPDYPEVAKKALKAMYEIAGRPAFDDKGMMQKGVIVRHLLLPGHKKNAMAVLQYVYKTYGDNVYFSLMNQYTPSERVKKEEFENLCRKVTKREYEAVIDYALSLGIRNAYIQEGETAKESFIPAFDGEGVPEGKEI